MSARGRSEALIPSAKREGSPVSPPGRPKGEFPARSAKGAP
jgi:hypothetical protein